MSSRKNILIIENSIHVTGALKSVTRLASDLSNDFNFIYILPRKSSGRFWIEKKGFTDIHELRMKELSRRFLDIILYFPFLIKNTITIRKYIWRSKIDLIHSNDLYNMLPVVYKIFGGKKPYICHVRFLPDRFPRTLFSFWLKLHLKFADQIIAVSEFLKSQLPNHPKIVCIPNELPTEEKYPHLDYDQIKAVYKFLYLGNFITGKGQDYALKAFAQVSERLPQWKLRFVGGDMGLQKNRIFRDYLKKESIKLGIENKVEWVDFAEDVEMEYKKADIVLNFSDSESFSITCVEALFFGLPLIATNSGGPAEIIDHNETGILVENKNIDAMATAMQRLADDRAQQKNLATRARLSVREKFSIEKTSGRLKQVYYKSLNL